MDLRDDGRPLPDGTAHPFHRTGTHIAHREDAWDACFEGTRNRCSRDDGVSTGQDEAIGILRDAAVLEPPGLRVGAYEEKHVTEISIAHASILAVSPARAQESAAPISSEGNELGLRQNLDVGSIQDPIDEVPRHAVRQVLAANEHEDVRRVASKVDGSLPG